MSDPVCSKVNLSSNKHILTRCSPYDCTQLMRTITRGAEKVNLLSITSHLVGIGTTLCREVARLGVFHHHKSVVHDKMEGDIGL